VLSCPVGGEVYNPGTDLDEAWINETRVDLPAIRRRAATLGTRRTVKKQWQAAWLCRALTCIDLTTLAGDDTEVNVQRLCLKAAKPIRSDIMKAIGMDELNLTCGAVCVYPSRYTTYNKNLNYILIFYYKKWHQTIFFTYNSCFSRVQDAVKALQQFNAPQIPVAAVATGFPSGQFSLKTRLEEIKLAIEAGATEIDIVINRELAIKNDWKGIYEEVKSMKAACGKIHMKSILAVGELGSFSNVYKASLVCMMAGSDFIKTSTGKEGVNATLPIGIMMCR
jgi:deoxyribose-phosphate aldolase